MKSKARSIIQMRSALIVDDDIESADRLGQLLQLEGLDVTVAYDGIEALKAFGKKPPDLAVLDLDLPGMDGAQLAEQFRLGRDRPPILLIAVSGYCRPQDVALCNAAGFDYHFRKPMDAERLVELINSFRRTTGLRENEPAAR